MGDGVLQVAAGRLRRDRRLRTCCTTTTPECSYHAARWSALTRCLKGQGLAAGGCVDYDVSSSDDSERTEGVELPVVPVPALQSRREHATTVAAVEGHVAWWFGLVLCGDEARPSRARWLVMGDGSACPLGPLK
ncbi:hypothetical protein ACP4OV_000369 [Aristida adscensionis]